MISDKKVTEYDIKDHALYRIEIIDSEIKVINLGKFHSSEKKKSWISSFIKDYSKDETFNHEEETEAPSIEYSYEDDAYKNNYSICHNCKKPAIGTQYLQNKLVYCKDCWESNNA